jgi:hypothetical protein
MTLHSSEKEIKNKSKYTFGTDKKVIVDSGTSFLLMPKDDRDLFVKYLEEEMGLMCV